MNSILVQIAGENGIGSIFKNSKNSPAGGSAQALSGGRLLLFHTLLQSSSVHCGKNWLLTLRSSGSSSRLQMSATPIT